MATQKKYDIQKIYDRIQAGEKLTKKEDKELEEYENTHTDNEFNLIIGLNREMTENEKENIILACTALLNSMGYDDVDISG
jgi:hypothetical protein